MGKERLKRHNYCCCNHVFIRPSFYPSTLLLSVSPSVRPSVLLSFLPSYGNYAPWNLESHCRERQKGGTMSVFNSLNSASLCSMFFETLKVLKQTQCSTTLIQYCTTSKVQTIMHVHTA